MSSLMVASPLYLLEEDDVVVSWWIGAREPEDTLHGRVRVTERNKRGNPRTIAVDWTDGRTDVYEGGSSMFTRYRRRGEVLEWEHLLQREPATT